MSVFSSVQRLAGEAQAQGYEPVRQAALTVDGLEEDEYKGDQSVVVPVEYEMTETVKFNKSPRSEPNSPAPGSLRWTSRREQQRNKRKAQIIWGGAFLAAMALAGYAWPSGTSAGESFGPMEDYAPIEEVVPNVTPDNAEQYAAPDLNRFTETFDEEYVDEEDSLPEAESDATPEPTIEAYAPVATTSSVTIDSAPAKSRTRVRARRHNKLYRGCSSSELLSSLKRATIRPDGLSRSNYTQPADYSPNELPLAEFSFSYDLPECPAPHIFTPQETCDLLSSFGGIYIRGDSLMRQFAQGIFLLLRDSFDLVRAKKKECAGNELFTNGRECKFESYFDSREFQSVCGEEAAVVYEQVWKYVPESWVKPGSKGKSKGDVSAHDAGLSLEEDYSTFLASLPASRKELSPIYVHGTGIHYSYDPERAFRFHVDPFARLASHVEPDQAAPVKLFSLALAPGANKPEKFLATQGPERAKAFNEEMNIKLDEYNKERGVENVARGAWGALDWFGTSEGAASYDGTHYSYQIVMERAQVFLNLLDVLHAEIVEDGGLVERAEVMELEA